MASIKGHNNCEKLIVGLGASAGGLDPIKTFVDSLPKKTGMAFVVIMHLDPDHESKLADILQNHTKLDVQQVTKRSIIECEHIYVAPPDKLLSVKDNYLELSEPEGKKNRIVAIDSFFRSLGYAVKKNAASIIFSGSGADGAVGIKAVKEQGGLTITQKPDKADYSSMPRSAVKTGVIDKVLPVKEMYAALATYKENLSQVDLFAAEEQDKVVQAITDRLKSETGRDFNNYKESTVLRRIERRMQVNDCLTLRAYLKFLEDHPEESEELYKDLLISVTSFFRDPQAFDAFKQKVIPELFKSKDADAQLRIWVPGAATGEEAYSIAILLREYMRQKGKEADVKIFASDIDRAALGQARKGIYPESIAAHFTDRQLNRYFIKAGHEYQIKDEISNMIVFPFHDMLNNPPFLKLDLITCRNVFIYLKEDIHAEVFQMFDYALRPEGWLFLGMSDSNIGASEFFEAVDKKYRIFQKRKKNG